MLYFERMIRGLISLVSESLPITVVCPYCGKNAKLVDSKEVYGKSYGMIWLCKPCDAYVGCHKNSKQHKPKGRLANKELRSWRMKAHDAFDPLWQRKMRKEKCSKSVARKAGYKWLAGELGIPYEECHISWLTIEQCQMVVKICQKFR